MKRFIALLLAAVMSCGIFAATCYADPPGDNDGEEEYVYIGITPTYYLPPIVIVPEPE